MGLVIKPLSAISWMSASLIAAPSSTLRILHVDDEPDILRLVRDSLSGEPIIVESAMTLTAACEQLGDRAPWGGYDLVLVDLNLPDSQGVATVEALRYVSIPIVVLSAIDNPETLKAAAAAGADDYLLKLGLTRARLIHRITFAHGRFLKRRQYEESEARRRNVARHRIDASVFEALKPYITCGSRAPFVGMEV